jgi:hypothetical protein
MHLPGEPNGEEYVEVVLKPARPPRTPPNLAERRDEQQGEEEKG